MASFVHCGHVARQGPSTFGKSFMMQRIVFGGKARQLYSKCSLQLIVSSKCNIRFFLHLHYTHLSIHPVGRSIGRLVGLSVARPVSWSVSHSFLAFHLSFFRFFSCFFFLVANKCFPVSLFLSCTRWKSYC